MKRLSIEEAAERVASFMRPMTVEARILACARGRADVHTLEPEDLHALTLEAGAITGIPLVGASHVPSRGRGDRIEHTAQRVTEGPGATSPRFERRPRRRHLGIARLGRTGPSPWPSCGSHCVPGEAGEGAAEAPSRERYVPGRWRAD